MTISPCAHPTCEDGHGNRALTTQTMCDRCRRHYRREVDWIVLDYVTLKHYLPAPATPPNSDTERRTTRVGFGHPAQWASDTARQIADALNEIEDGLRDWAGDAPAPHRGTSEPGRVNHAYQHITGRFPDLCTYPGAEATATEIHDLHAHVRRTLGLTRYIQHLPTPCPACDVTALARDIGQITCGACFAVIPEDRYDFLARVTLDVLIDAYDTQTEGVVA